VTLSFLKDRLIFLGNCCLHMGHWFPVILEVFQNRSWDSGITFDLIPDLIMLGLIICLYPFLDLFPQCQKILSAKVGLHCVYHMLSA
jgi:hypothetical protein